MEKPDEEPCEEADHIMMIYHLKKVVVCATKLLTK